MIKVVSGMTAGTCRTGCGADGLISRSRDLGQVQEDWNFIPEGAFRNKETGQNKKINDSLNLDAGRRQSFWSDHPGWHYPGPDDFGLIGWKQVDGKWCSFKVNGKRLHDDLPDDSSDQRNVDNSDTSGVLNETRTPKPTGDKNPDIVVQRQEEVNVPNGTKDADITNQGSVSENTYNHVSYAESGGNSNEAIEPQNFSYEYDNEYHKNKEKSYTKKL